MHCIFELGRLTALSTFELTQLFPGTQWTDVADHLVAAEIPEDIALATVKTSGGVVKLREVVTHLDATVGGKEVIEHLAKILQTVDRPTFSIHEINRPNQQSPLRLQDVKNALKAVGVASRFIESPATGLSASVLLHQDVTELTIIYSAASISISKTLWVQDIDEWTLRDRIKPERDAKRGMLPPKLARMMVNFTSSELREIADRRLYDPFCGSGTLLMEAQLTGWQTVGSDLSPEAVHDSAKNMHWFSQMYDTPDLSALFIADATNVTLAQLGGKKVHAIVTEPFLGKQQPAPATLPNVFKGLEKQYWGALKNWTKLLHDGGEVVIVTPLVRHKNTIYSLESIIDKSKTLGYNVVSGPLIYNRPQTIVQRAIYVLKFAQA